MKYSITWSVPCIPYISGNYGSSEFITVIRYDSGNYTISDGVETCRITAKELEKRFPGIVRALRKKAGVREYAIS